MPVQERRHRRRLNAERAGGAGAADALKAAGKSGVLIVSVDGGCQGVENVQNGTIGATSQQYPLKMAQLGVEAVAKIARGGEKPAVTPGLDFYDTGSSSSPTPRSRASTASTPPRA